MDIYSLYSKERGVPFTTEELNYLRENIKRDYFTIHYGVWKQFRHNGKYIALVIEQGRSARKSAFEHSMIFVCSRELCDIEFEEEIANWGSNTRRFIGYYFDNVEGVIQMDQLYKLQTPQKFIDYCNKDLPMLIENINQRKPFG